MRNFKEISRKDDNIKSHKKPGFNPLFRRYNFRKTTAGVKLTPTPSAVLELSIFFWTPLDEWLWSIKIILWKTTCFRHWNNIQVAAWIYKSPIAKTFDGNIRSNHPEVFLGGVALQLYWNRTSAWVFSCKFAADFQNTY